MPEAYESYQFSLKREEEVERPGSNSRLNSFSSTSLNRRDHSSNGAAKLSIALIGPDEERRKAMARTLAEFRGGEVREFSSYPPALDNVPKMLDRYYDVIIIDLDSDLEYALELVESIRAEESATVMVYSAKADQQLVFRCMRAGAREFLIPPFDQSAIFEALARATTAPRPGTRQAKRTRGKLMVFLGAKGGSGVTTIACNFAIALAQESSQSTLLVDLGLPLGDAALNLGIITDYSTDHAFQDVDRLDGTFLSKLLAKHRSGISVLAAPSKVPKIQASGEAIDKLMKAARLEFENVIVDVGSRLDLIGTALFNEASTIYLVTQAGISELRNSNRILTEFFSQRSPKLEVVINRYEPNSLGLTDEHINKALNRPVQWKIPDNYAAVRQMQTTTSTVTLVDSPISRPIRQMARSTCGLPPLPEKTIGFRLRSLGRNAAEKISSTEEQQASADVTATIAWPTPDPIVYGTRLNTTQLDATASVLGTFAYTPAVGYLLPAGTHTLWVTFTPVETAGGAPLQTAVSITVEKATPAINWPAPPAIACGTALSALQLNATASAPGTFAYTPPAGEVLAAGKYELSATFTPTDTANYAPAQATVPVTVAKAPPSVSWPTPAPITFGTALSDAQLNASASAPGTFAYTPPTGEMLPAGKHELSVTFTPTDTANYTTAQSTVLVTVAKAQPAVSWPMPAPIARGTALSDTQLNASASAPGTFVYAPAAGEVLTAGKHELSVTFTPTDTANYTAAKATVSVTVAKAPPSVSWPAPAPITCATALSDAQLNATASTPGKFEYTPAAGGFLAPGRHILSVTFTPADTNGYTTGRATVELTVIKSTPAVAWPTPAPITYGTKLSENQLSAMASIPGRFVYTPGEGAILGAGTHTPFVTFTPKDTTSYTAVQAAVALTVNKAEPSVSWETPGPISDSTPLAARQLNASASVAGSFDYNPAAGQTLPVGTHSLSVTFTPMDTENYSTVQATVSIIVTKVAPTTIKWDTPAAISYGTALSSAQLNATSAVPGTFAYSPSEGDVLATGRHKLHVTFSPTDSMKYATAEYMEVIEVEGVTNLDSLLNASTQTPLAATETKDQADLVDANREESEISNTINQNYEPQTRVYKGATYEKGEDGQWHLQRK